MLIDDQQPDDNTLYITKDINNIEHTSLQISIVPFPESQVPQDDQDTFQVSKYQALSQFFIT